MCLPTFHICNTFFERELEEVVVKPLVSWMRSSSITQKLQTLPLFYARPEDRILVTDLPVGPCDPRLCLMNTSHLLIGNIEHWGASKAIALWAQERNVFYKMPAWEVVRTINSKIFSFTHAQKLPHASLLHDEKEVQVWIAVTPGPKVLKTPFGTAGRGHFHIPSKGNLSSFLKKEFEKNLPLIGEPWVERTFDFSTQWKDGRFLGATVLENSRYGSYRSTLVGPQFQLFGPYEWALKAHIEIVRPLLNKIHQLGFFGNLGVDAFVYRWKAKETLHPVVEINGRKTMGWAALRIQELRAPEQRLRFSFSRRNGVSFAVLNS